MAFVIIDGAPVPAGTLVAAYCGGNVYRSTLTTTQAGAAWYMNLDIPGDDPATPAKDGCASGETVYFYIGSAMAIKMATGSAAAAAARPLPLVDVGQEHVDARRPLPVRWSRRVHGHERRAGHARPGRVATVRNTDDHGRRVPVVSGASKVWTFGPYTFAVDFAVAQRPVHPGSSAPHLEPSCTADRHHAIGSGLPATRPAAR